MEGVLTWLPWAFVAAVALFGLGWVGGRMDLKRLLSESRAVPTAYFKGVSHLLNDDADKALDALTVAVQDHPDALDLQFALGVLYRRRGEIDRALRVHEAIADRSGVSADIRATARYECALDYHRSGLLDHAERILKGILEGAGISEPRRRAARSLLLDVYQQERNWQSAIDVATALDETTPAGKRRHAAEIAHFWCELAAEAIANGDAASAQQRLAHALAANAQCVRANVLKAEWAAKSAQHRQVVDAIHAIEAQDARYLGLVAELFLHANAALGRDAEGLSAIREMHAANPSLDLFNVIFKATLVRNGAAAAAEIAKEDLRANPTLVGLDRLMEAELPEPSDAGRAEAERRRNVVHSHASRLAVYLCGSCGFKAKQWYWHCPACNGWETFPPRRTAEYDTAERHLARLTAEHIDNRKGTA